MRRNRNRMVNPDNIHGNVLRQDLGVPVAADLLREAREETRHDTGRRQPEAVVGRIAVGDTGTKELLRILNNRGDIDDRTAIGDDGVAARECVPMAVANIGAGTVGGQSATIADGTDATGRLVVVTGSNPAAASVASPAVVATVTFGQPRDDERYYVSVRPIDPTAAPVPWFVDWDDAPDKATRWRLQTTAQLTASSTYHLLAEVVEID